MAITAPEGSFGWGFPEWGRPRIEIVARYRDGLPDDGIGQTAVVDVECGGAVNLRARLTVACVSSDSVAIIRGLAFQKFATEIRDLADHIDSLADTVQSLDSNDVWRGGLMQIDGARRLDDD